MPERNRLAAIHEVTDDDSGLYHIGEIEGGFDLVALARYLRVNGEVGLSRLASHFTFLQAELWTTWAGVKSAKDATVRYEAAIAPPVEPE